MGILNFFKCKAKELKGTKDGYSEVLEYEKYLQEQSKDITELTDYLRRNQDIECKIIGDSIELLSKIDISEENYLIYKYLIHKQSYNKHLVLSLYKLTYEKLKDSSDILLSRCVTTLKLTDLYKYRLGFSVDCGTHLEKLSFNFGYNRIITVLDKHTGKFIKTEYNGIDVV